MNHLVTCNNAMEVKYNQTWAMLCESMGFLCISLAN